jgi:hypothetical protein
LLTIIFGSMIVLLIVCSFLPKNIF